MADLETLARTRNVARQKVKDWMDAEGAKGRLRHNGDAPAWPEYELAQRALDAAVAAVK